MNTKKQSKLNEPSKMPVSYPCAVQLLTPNSSLLQDAGIIKLFFYFIIALIITWLEAAAMGGQRSSRFTKGSL
jgi:hypothetical protein